MLAIRLPEAIEERLAALASETGRTKTALVREAVVEYIDDLEDLYLAESRARSGRKTIPSDRSRAGARPCGLSSTPARSMT